MEEEKKQKEARKKMEIIAPLLDPHMTKRERTKKKKEIAKEKGLSVKTVHRYYMQYINGGYNALLPKEQIRPENRVVPLVVIDEAVKMLKELPTRSVEDIIQTLETEGIIEEGTVKRSTLQRNLQEAGWGKKQIRDRTFASDTAVFRFSKRHRLQVLIPTHVELFSH